MSLLTGEIPPCPTELNDLRLYLEQYLKLLQRDIVNLTQSNEIPTGGTIIPMGDELTNGSWRFYMDGTYVRVQRRESDVWVDKFVVEPS